jgi:hypothetical protein
MTEYDNENGKSKTDTMMANQNSSLIIEDEERTAG